MLQQPIEERGTNSADMLQQPAAKWAASDANIQQASDFLDLEAGGRLRKPVAAGSDSDAIAASSLGGGMDGNVSGDFTVLSDPWNPPLEPPHPQGGDGDLLHDMEEDGPRVDEPAPPDKAPTADGDKYLLRLANNYVSLAIKISYHGIFSTAWMAAESAAALGLGGGDYGRLSLVMMLLGLLVAGLVLQVLSTAALGRRGTACSSRRYQVIVLCMAVGVLVLTVVVMALRVILASYLVTSLIRSTFN